MIVGELFHDHALHKSPFSDFYSSFNALKSTSFKAFQIISDFFLTDALAPLQTLYTNRRVCTTVHQRSYCDLECRTNTCVVNGWTCYDVPVEFAKSQKIKLC